LKIQLLSRFKTPNRGSYFSPREKCILKRCFWSRSACFQTISLTDCVRWPYGCTTPNDASSSLFRLPSLHDSHTSILFAIL
jgi:hypothetical protein